MNSKKNKILIVFETANNILSEGDILNSPLLMDYYCEFITYEKLSKNANMLNDYKVVFDCTSNLKIMKFIENKGIFIKNLFNYYNLNDVVFINGFQIHSFLISKENEGLINKEVKENMKSTFETYKKMLDFLKNNFLEEENFSIEDFSEKLNKGIEISGQKKRYVLVKNIPEEKEENTEYVMASSIALLKDVFEVFDYIKGE